jgi:hypothetical protein
MTAKKHLRAELPALHITALLTGQWGADLGRNLGHGLARDLKGTEERAGAQP